MKAQFLKIAKVKDEKAFYKKYPTEAAFFKAHPEAKSIKKAQMGADLNYNGIPDYLENVNPVQGPIQNKLNFQKPSLSINESIYNPTVQSGLPTYTPSIQDTISQGQAITNAPAQKVAPLNTSSLGDKVMPYIGAAQNVFSGIKGLGAQGDEVDKWRQMRKVTDVQKIASGTREEAPERRYVKPWDIAVQPNQMSPTYGMGTNVLTAEDGAEIQNTYAPGTIYDDGGYEPLNDSDQVKQYARGGYIQQAQDGGGFMNFMGSQGGGQALGMLSGAMNNNSAESQIGQGIGTAAGTAFFGPVGGMVGGALGGAVGGLFNTSQKSIARDKKAVQRNQDTIMGNQFAEGFQNQYSSVVRNGGNIPNYEEGGWVSHDWQPQVITSFGGLNEQEVYDYAHEGMDSLRSGGHLTGDYTPISNRGMQTYAMGGELKTHWGGHAETMSHNPYLPGNGETVMFRGQSHDESDGKGNTGIGITYGNSPVEVERGEPAVKLQDGSSGEENLTVYGNLQIPNEYVSLLGDDKAKGKKFKNYIAQISKGEARQNKIVEKSTNELNDLDVKSPFDKLKLDALTANINGANMKLKSIADKKINAAHLQNAINDTAKEHGLIADDLAKGKIKFDKQSQQQTAKFGGKFTQAAEGVKSGKTEPVVIPPSDMTKLSKEDYNYLKKLYDEAEAQGTGPAVEKFQKEYTRIAPEQAKSITSKYTATNYAKKKGISNLDPSSNFDKIFGKRTRAYGASLGEAEGATPLATTTTASDTKKTDTKKEIDKTYETSPYKRSVLMDVANQILPYIRPTDQEALDPNQLLGEYYALSSNQLEPVQAQSYQPDLGTPYDISLQDQLNANQADFNAMQRMVGYNPAALAQLNAQKYAANTGVLGEQFRMNQAERAGVYDKNRDVLNQAKLANISMYDTQYGRQAQAKSNTKAITQAALNSIGDKYAKNRLENRELGIYENLYNYRYDPSGRAINMNPLYQPNMPTVYGKQENPNMVPVYDASGNQTGWKPALATESTVADNSITTADTTTEAPKGKYGKAITKYAKNGSIVKSYKNL